MNQSQCVANTAASSLQCSSIMGRLQRHSPAGILVGLDIFDYCIDAFGIDCGGRTTGVWIIMHIRALTQSYDPLFTVLIDLVWGLVGVDSTTVQSHTLVLILECQSVAEYTHNALLLSLIQILVNWQPQLKIPVSDHHTCRMT
jgi:hypothetical protein